MNKFKIFMLRLFIWCRTCTSRVYGKQDVYLYSINQTEILDSNVLIPPETPNPNELKLWNNQYYSVLLVMSQRAIEEKKVPVWKFIDERLKDIDLYVRAVECVIDELFHWSNFEVSSGTSGVLMLNKTTSDVNKRQLMYLWDTELQCMVPIPKFVYRIVRAWCHRIFQEYNAVIVIHNDPNTSDSDRLDCIHCQGWDEIENMWTYDEPGLSYVCHLTEEISKILGLDGYYNSMSESKPLHLSHMVYSFKEYSDWNSYWNSDWQSGEHEQTSTERI